MTGTPAREGYSTGRRSRSENAILAARLMTPDESVRAAAVARVAAADPAARLALRKDPLILPVAISDLVSRSIAIAISEGSSRAVTRSQEQAVRDLTHDIDRALDLAHGLGHKIGDRLDRSLDHSYVIDEGPDDNLPHGFARYLAREKARGNARFLAQALGQGIARARTLDRARALALTADPALARDLARDLAADPALAATRTLNRAQTIAHNLDIALDPARAFELGRHRDLFPFTRDLAVDRSHALAENLRLASSLDRVLADDLARDLVGALGTARKLASNLDRALGLGLTRELTYTRDRHINRDRAFARKLARDLHRNRVLDLSLGLSSALGTFAAGRLGLGDAAGIAGAVLAGALDDFTQADLTGIGIAEADLAGIRWSEQHTQWPPKKDLERLRSISEMTEPHSGVWVIRQPDGQPRRL